MGCQDDLDENPTEMIVCFPFNHKLVHFRAFCSGCISLFPLEFGVVYFNSSGWCSSSKSEDLLFCSPHSWNTPWLVVSYMFVIFIPNVGEMIQFDLRIFFKMG